MRQVMTKSSSLLTLLSILVLSGCAALPKNISLSDADKAMIKTADIIVTRQKTPGFIFSTPSKALVDAGMAKWIDPNEAITWGVISKGHDIPDFTRSVEKVFLSEIAMGNSRLNLKYSKSIEPWDESADFSRLSAKYEAGYVLQFRTRIGIFSYKPFAWQTYQMSYFGDVVLVRLKDQKPIWKVSCDVKATDENPLTLPGRDFLSGRGKLFKAASAYATSTCGKQMAREFNAIF